MAIVQSQWGAQKRQAPVSAEAGGVVCEKYKFVVTSNMAIGDIIELGVLPSYHTAVDTILISDAIGTTALDVGIMTGEVGSPDQTRTMGNEFFSSAPGDALVRPNKQAGFRLQPVERDRSIGVKIMNAALVASSQVIELIVFSKQ